MNEDKSTRYHHRRRLADGAGVALLGAFLGLWSASGLGAALRAAIEWSLRGLPGAWTPVFVSGACLLALAVAVQAVRLPAAWYQGYWLERKYGLSRETQRQWFTGHLVAAAVSGIVMAAGAGVAYGYMSVWPQGWWVAAATATFSIAMVGVSWLAPALVLPAVSTLRPLGRADLAERISRLAVRAGTPVVGVDEWRIARHSTRANAAMAGVGRSRRILLSDTMLNGYGYGDEEIEVVVAHELAHLVHHDLWTAIALRSLTMGLGLVVVAQVLPSAASWLGLRGPGDVAGAPVLLLVLGACWLLMQPVSNALSRAQERRADRFALTLTGNPAAFVSVIRRLGQQNLSEDRPSVFSQWLLASHPPLRERIAFAEAWSAMAPAASADRPGSGRW